MQICHHTAYAWVNRNDDDCRSDDDEEEELRGGKGFKMARVCWQICHHFLPGCLLLEEEKGGHDNDGSDDDERMMIR